MLLVRQGVTRDADTVSTAPARQTKAQNHYQR